MVDNMRKVTFLINDLEWFRKFYKMLDAQFKNIYKTNKKVA